MNNTIISKSVSSRNKNSECAPLEENQRQLKFLNQQTKDFNCFKQPKSESVTLSKQQGVDNYLPYDQIDEKLLANVKLIRTPEDDEFSQILKQKKPFSVNNVIHDSHRKQENRYRQNEINNSFRKSDFNKVESKFMLEKEKYSSILDDKNFNFTTSIQNKNFMAKNSDFMYNNDEKKFKIEKSTSNLPFNTFNPYQNEQSDLFQTTNQLDSNIESFIDQNLFSTNNISRKNNESLNNSASNSHQYFSPEFGNSELSFQNKRTNDNLKRNLFSNSLNQKDLTLEQFSQFSFQRNPFISKDKISFEQSQVINKPIPIEKCENYQFLCPPCFELVSQSSQDSIESIENNSTAKKKSVKQRQSQNIENEQNEIQSTCKKISQNCKNEKEQNYFENIKSIRSKIPCFCQNGIVGYKQYYNKLLEIHFNNVVKVEEVKNFFRFLVWTLSQKQQLSIECLFYKIEKRIYLTKCQQFKPFLQRYIQQLKQQKQIQKQQLSNQKAKIKDQNINVALQNISKSKINQIILYIGEIIETDQTYLIELTDTWSSVYKVVYKHLQQNNANPSFSNCSHRRSISLNSQDDFTLRDKNIKRKIKMTNNQLLEDLILRKQLKPFTKVRIAHLELTQEQKITVQFENTKKEFNNLVEFPINSFQKELNPNTKIGFLNKPFLRTLSSIKPQGGLIPTIDVFILKRYPLLVQYYQNPSKKIITYSEAINSSVVSENSENDYFYAKYLICDSLYAYDKSNPLSTQPNTELVIKFQSPSFYKAIQEGQRLRILNSICEQFEMKQNQESKYKIMLKADSTNILHQNQFLMKSDLSKCQSFFNGIAKNLVKSKHVEDISSYLNVNYLEALDFDIKVDYRSFSLNNNSIIGEIQYFKERYSCEILTHHQYFQNKLLKIQPYTEIQLINVHFKSMNAEKKKFYFKTSFNTDIVCD